ncbi:MAG: WYL domain-containing protein, partial [Burkholderiaceae bacterium]
HFLLLNHPVWYVLAFDQEKKAGRCFRLDRIEHAKVMDEHFRLRPATELMDEVSSYFSEV